MKWLKYAAYALGGILVLLIAVVAFVAATFDPNAYKGEIERAVKERTGRTLKFHGDIGLAFWPSVGAKVGRTTLSRRASAHDFAAFDAARAHHSEPLILAVIDLDPRSHPASRTNRR